MAIDFEKIAAAANETHEKKLAEKEAAFQLERQVHAEKAKRCIAFLDEHVVHALNTAKTAFKKNDIDIDIKADYDVLQFSSRLPKVEAKMSRLAPGRSDGYRISSTTAHYSCDEEKILVRLEREVSTNEPERNIGEGKGHQIEVLVGQSISELTASFYKAIERYAR